MRIVRVQTYAFAVVLTTGACGSQGEDSAAGSDGATGGSDGVAAKAVAGGVATDAGAGGVATDAGAGGVATDAGAGGVATDAGAGGVATDAGAGGSTASGDASVPGQSCDEPTPWALPASKKVVGDGTAASCTADALSQAVTAGGHVTFNCGDSPVTIAISTPIQVGAETVVDGEGKITLDGGGTSRIFIVTNKLSVRNLSFINGKAPDDSNGGAVKGEWRSNVEVIGCTFEDNTAGTAGGAIGVWTGSSLTVVASQFRRNKSGYGGAIYSLWSPLHIVNSEFTDNSAFVDSNGGAIGTDGALDPAYRNPHDGVDTAGGTVEICGSRFQNNEAYGAGGAAFLWVYPPDKVIIDRCTVEGNTLGKDSGGTGVALGGGMRVSNGEITIKGTSFLSNLGETHGGGLYLDCEPTCTITNSTFYSNKATDGYGGAIFGDKLRVNNVTFAKNFAKGHGGALFGGSDWVFKNTVFADNKAGNPWGQAYSCSATGTGDHVLQWVTDFKGVGSDPCISNPTAADPNLADPADNGGITFTMLPGAGSPVLGAGAGCEPVDQRGQPRDTAACDLGAVEAP
ncbi:right-handed parallel beta-helix repeat-containing protein [Sorangium sp. So ce341]|uniref:right-handed parallel beta-helix repeat-containing protein n=1 Tax=Sorangium sp. So ce341 TaxID=3133302 RepID=UPI003F615F3F